MKVSSIKNQKEEKKIRFSFVLIENNLMGKNFAVQWSKENGI